MQRKCLSVFFPSVVKSDVIFDEDIGIIDNRTIKPILQVMGVLMRGRKDLLTEGLVAVYQSKSRLFVFKKQKNTCYMEIFPNGMPPHTKAVLLQ